MFNNLVEHQSIDVDDSTSVLKVHGGLIYKFTLKSEGNAIAISTVFVPFTESYSCSSDGVYNIS